jgi:hypothetical protein
VAGSIDATVVLGLAGKMNQVFAEPGTYRSFPPSPIGLKDTSLRAMMADPLGAGAGAHSSFSVLVNEIPDGPMWMPDGGMVWDVYGDVLSRAQLAETTRTPQQEADYAKAFGFLYQTRADGSVVPSPAVVAYEQCRDAYRAATNEYNNRRGEAELTADPAVRARWAADEPDLRARISELSQDWTSIGRRAEVDGARQVFGALASTTPAVVWSGFRRLFDPTLPEIYFRTSLEGQPYVPTGYLPSDVVDVAWPRITATADELRALAEQAPPELRERLSSGGAAGIQRVSFEYTSVTLSRPWFTPQLFASRAWRFADGRMLSDGAAPPKGECTAYVTGLVLARAITVESTARRPEQPTPWLGFLPTDPQLLIELDPPKVPWLDIIDLEDIRPLPTEERPRVVVVDDEDSLVHAGHEDGAVVNEVAAARLGAGRQDVVFEAAADRAQLVDLIAPLPAEPATVRDDWQFRIEAVRGDMDLSRELPPPAAPEGVVTTTTDVHDIYVLAFQCRTLPKSPDPDPSFVWPTP